MFRFLYMYIFVLWFLLSCIIFYLFPHLFSAVADRMSTILPRIYDAGLKRAARGPLEMTGREKSPKNSPSAHCRTILSGYILATKAHIDNRKNLLNSNMSPTCFHNMVKLLAAEIRWRVSVTSANLKRFRVLAALLHGTLVVGFSQTTAPPIFGRAAITLGIRPHSSIRIRSLFINISETNIITCIL